MIFLFSLFLLLLTGILDSMKKVFFSFILLLLFSPLSFATPVDKIIIVKSQRLMTLISKEQVVRQFEVSLGKNPIGAKIQRGDEKTPEGRYKIDYKKPNSSFHRALRISYPNRADRARAKALGVDPGGDIMIHGLDPRYAGFGSLHLLVDWTNGCIAVTNPEIEEIYALVSEGTEVVIFP